jgi:hypothetical protein
VKGERPLIYQKREEEKKEKEKEQAKLELEESERKKDEEDFNSFLKMRQEMENVLSSPSKTKHSVSS